MKKYYNLVYIFGSLHSITLIWSNFTSDVVFKLIKCVSSQNDKEIVINFGLVNLGQLFSLNVICLLETQPAKIELNKKWLPIYWCPRIQKNKKWKSSHVGNRSYIFCFWRVLFSHLHCVSSSLEFSKWQGKIQYFLLMLLYRFSSNFKFNWWCNKHDVMFVVFWESYVNKVIDFIK